jgi:hypothetical protein
MKIRQVVGTITFILLCIFTLIYAISCLIRSYAPPKEEPKYCVYQNFFEDIYTIRYCYNGERVLMSSFMTLEDAKNTVAKIKSRDNPVYQE